jgi:hypothetical protein
MQKGKCILHATKKYKLKVWVGITLGGILLISLTLIVAIVVYRNKLRRKENGVANRKEQEVANKRSMLEMEPRSFLYQG